MEIGNLPRRRDVLGLIGGLPLLGTGELFAQETYPSRSVRMVVPFPAGGSLDGCTRKLAAELTQRLGQAFVVDNVTGANGKIGTNTAIAAAPDGYTLLSTFDGAFSIPNPESPDAREPLLAHNPGQARDTRLSARVERP